MSTDTKPCGCNQYQTCGRDHAAEQSAVGGENSLDLILPVEEPPSMFSGIPENIQEKLAPGDQVWSHPQGAFLVLTDRRLVKYNKAGKAAKTSATPEKLAAGHGGWVPLGTVPGDDSDDGVSLAAVPWREGEDLKDPPAGARFEVPMTFKEVPVEDVQRYIDDPNFYFQQKVDGIRGQLVFQPGVEPWFRSKDGGRLASSSAAKATHPILNAIGPEGANIQGDFTVDGEVLDGEFYVFDLVDGGAETTPWEARMAGAEGWVEQMHAAGVSQIRTIPVARTAEEKAALWRSVGANGGEGVVMKRRDARYQAGSRVDHTLKAKITASAEVVVIDRHPEKDSVSVGVYQQDGSVKRIGSVSTIGKDPNISEGDVVEVEYLWANPKTLGLQQPRIKTRRPDKTPAEATASQLRFVDKTVLDPERWA